MPADDFLPGWAATPYQPLAGQVVFLAAQGGSALETLGWETGQCVGYQEEFVAGDPEAGAYVCYLLIAAPKLTIQPGGPLATASAEGAPGVVVATALREAPDVPTSFRALLKPPDPQPSPHLPASEHGTEKVTGSPLTPATPQLFKSVFADEAPTVFFGQPKLGRILTSLEKQGIAIWMDEDTERFLQQMGAEAMYWANGLASPGTLVLPRAPSRTQVVEELIHLGKARQRGWTEHGTPKGVVEEELATQAKLLSLARSKGWQDSEIAQLERAQQYWRDTLAQLDA